MLAEGSRVDERYMIERVLGRGGMGVVYRARDERLQRTVALKVLRGARVGSEAARVRLVGEARTLAGLRHPGIVQVHDVGTLADGGTYLVMELVEGQSLRASAVDGVTREVVLRWIEELAAALTYAHLHGVVHRDVKPDNAMVRDDGSVVLIDFGLFKSVAGPLADTAAPDEALAALTASGAVVGTPAYLAPEQARGASSPKVDQWSLGVTAYELLGGALPWDGADPVHVLAQLLTEAPPPLSSRLDDVPRAVDAALARAMAQEPEDRYDDPATFARALRSAFDADPVDAPPPPTPTPDESMDDAPPSPAPRPRAPGVADPAPPGRTRWRGISLGVTLTILAVVAWLIGSGRARDDSADHAASAPPAPIEGAQRIAVFPLEVRGPEGTGWVGDAITYSLSSKLELGDDLSAVDSHAIAAATSGEGAPEPEAAVAFARDLGATHHVLGDVVVAGERVEVLLTLYDRRGEPISRLERRGRLDDLLNLGETLAAGLLADRAAPLGLRLTGVAATQTRSLEAMRAYLGAERSFFASRWDEAREGYARATELDPLFALAHYRLALVGHWLSDAGLMDESLRRVEALEGRLAPRERSLMKGLRAYRNADYARARDTYAHHVERYPADVEAWLQLGETQLHLGPVHGSAATEARGAFERVVELVPHHPLGVDHLMVIAAMDHAPERIEALFEGSLPPDLRDRYRNAIQLTRGEPPRMDAEGCATFLLLSLPRLAGHELLGADALRCDGEPLAPDIRASAAAAAAFAHGRPSQAVAALRAASDHWIAPRIESEMAVALLAPLRASAADRTALCEAFGRFSDSSRGTDPQGTDPHARHRDAIRAYLHARCGHRAAMQAFMEEVPGAPSKTPDVAHSLRLQHRALEAHDRGDDEEALALAQRFVPPRLFKSHHSAILSGIPAAYVRIESLIALHRGAEALPWLTALRQQPLHSRALAAWSWRREGEVQAEAGRVIEARRAFDRYLALMESPEEVFAAEVAEVRATLDTQ